MYLNELIKLDRSGMINIRREEYSLEGARRQLNTTCENSNTPPTLSEQVLYAAPESRWHHFYQCRRSRTQSRA